MRTVRKFLYGFCGFFIVPLSGFSQTPASEALFSFSLEKEGPGIVRVSLLPKYPFPGQIYSMSLLPADTRVNFPLPKEPSQKEKDASILVAFEITSNLTLTTPFYKVGKMESGKIRNPFAKVPVTDLSGKSVGSKARGILFFMARNVGPGITMTPSGPGQISWKEGKGFSFLLHFRHSPSRWKILLGVVHVDLIHPYLKSPLISSIFGVS